VRCVAGLERERAIGRRRPGAELAGLRYRAAGQLGAADPAGKAEVVLDPARRSGLAAEHGALDDQGLEPLRGAVYGGPETRRAASDHRQVDLLARAELQPDPDRARELAVARVAKLDPARQPHERQLVLLEIGDDRLRLRIMLAFGVAPDVRETSAPRVVDQPARRCRGPRPDDLQADALALLEDLAPAHERVQQHVGERPVLEQQRPQLLAVDRDVAHRLRRDAIDVDGLPREQVQLAEEAPRALAGDLVSGPVEDRRLALEDDDERIARVTDPEQELSLRGRALLAPRRESLKLPGGEDGAERARHARHASEGTARAAELDLKP
jgi:hypothetical protein